MCSAINNRRPEPITSRGYYGFYDSAVRITSERETPRWIALSRIVNSNERGSRMVSGDSLPSSQCSFRFNSASSWRET